MSNRLAKLIDFAHSIGSRPEFTFSDVGSVSFKSGDLVLVQEQGALLSDLTEAHFVKLGRKRIAELLDQPVEDDVRAAPGGTGAGLLTCRMHTEIDRIPHADAALHGLVDFAFAIKTESYLIDSLLCSKDGRRIAQDLMPDGVWIEYECTIERLAQSARRELRLYRTKHSADAPLVLLERHGIVVGGDTVSELRDRLERVVDGIAGFLDQQSPLPSREAKRLERRDAYVRTVLPLLRGLTFDGEKGNLVVLEDEPKTAAFLSDPHTKAVLTNPLTPAHIRLCNEFPLHLYRIENDEDLSDDDLETRLTEHTIEQHSDYVSNHPVSPKIAILEDIGFVAMGESYLEATTARDAYEEIIRTTESIRRFSEPAPLGGDEIARIESLLGRTTQSGGRPGTSQQTRPGGRRHRRRGILENKVAVVTGGARGFGEGIARGLVERGSLVFIADLNLEGAKKLACELNTLSSRTVAIPLRVDVSDEASVRGMILEIVEKAGGVDIFVSNAGVVVAVSVKEMKLSDFEFIRSVNYTGYFLCTKHVSRVLALQNRPSGGYFSDIIQINSKSGLQGSNRNSAYAGSKFGGIGLTQSYALELVEDNIKVNAICPGNYLEGPLWSDPERGLFAAYLEAGKVPGAQTMEDVRRYYESRVPLRRGCTPGDLVKAICYIVDQKYETGQAIPVTGGQVMLA